MSRAEMLDILDRRRLAGSPRGTCPKCYLGVGCGGAAYPRYERATQAHGADDAGSHPRKRRSS